MGENGSGRRSGGHGGQLDYALQEKILALLAVGKAKNAVARELGISWSTVDKYSRIQPGGDSAALAESAETLAKLREQKKAEFVEAAWHDITAAMVLGREKIRLATVTLESFGESIERLIKLLENNPETNGKDIIELIKALSSVTNIPLSHISTYFGVLYDKQALASGDKSGEGINVNVAAGPTQIIIADPDALARGNVQPGHNPGLRVLSGGGDKQVTGG